MCIFRDKSPPVVELPLLLNGNFLFFVIFKIRLEVILHHCVMKYIAYLFLGGVTLFGNRKDACNTGGGDG